ncbi:MAG: hypothetical protein WBA54_10520 [Acidaminobacteraceae bacterium]
MLLSEVIKDLLASHKKKRITLFEIEKKLPANTMYEDYANVILNLMDEKVILPIASSGFNNRFINLPIKFSIDENKILQKHINELFSSKIEMHEMLDFSYYIENIKEWIKDKNYIFMVNDFLQSEYKDIETASTPERSYQICGD